MRRALHDVTRFWLERGYERITLRIRGLEQRGEYYSFFAKRTRKFSCNGQVSPWRP